MMRERVPGSRTLASVWAWVNGHRDRDKDMAWHGMAWWKHLHSVRYLHSVFSISEHIWALAWKWRSG